MKSVLNIHWKDWGWNSNTLATWCEVPTHWKRPWCWKRLKVGEEGANRGWWVASPTQWTWVWASSGSWWWTGRPGVLQSVGSQIVGHYWATVYLVHAVTFLSLSSYNVFGFPVDISHCDYRFQYLLTVESFLLCIFRVVVFMGMHIPVVKFLADFLENWSFISMFRPSSSSRLF